MAGTRFEGDIFVPGNIGCRTLTIPAGTVLNAGVGAAAALAATKLIHQHHLTYAQDSAVTATNEERVVHVVYGSAGTSVSFECGCVVTNDGECTVTFDLLKNGTTVLAAGVAVNSNHSAYELVTATISTTALVDGDVLEITIVTAGTDTVGLGAFCSLVLREDPE